jgi:hypothetical protein
MMIRALINDRLRRHPDRDDGRRRLLSKRSTAAAWTPFAVGSAALVKIANAASLSISTSQI